MHAELSMPGYKLFHANRPTNNKGGRVLLYRRWESMPVELLPKNKFPEQVWCKLNLQGGKELLIEVYYRLRNEYIFGKYIDISIEKWYSK